MYTHPPPHHSKFSLDLCSTRHGSVYTTVGVHPGRAAEVPLEDIAKIRELAKSGRGYVVAIGECGLDVKDDKEPREDERVIDEDDSDETPAEAESRPDEKGKEKDKEATSTSTTTTTTTTAPRVATPGIILSLSLSLCTLTLFLYLLL